MSAIGWSVKQFRVFPGIESHGLTLFPVVGDSSVKTDALLTLQEALQARLVEIAEFTSASGPEFASGPQVNRLGIVNKSDRPVILIGGEIVVGGMQAPSRRQRSYPGATRGPYSARCLLCRAWPVA